MQTNLVKSQIPNYAPNSQLQIQEKKPIPPKDSIKFDKPLKDILITDLITKGDPFKPTQIFFGSPQEMVKETINDILRAKENGKGQWCGTPMMMDIMHAHARFDSMVGKQDQETLEKLRDFIVNTLSHESNSEVGHILHQLYQSVDSAIELPVQYVTESGIDPDGSQWGSVGPSKDSQKLKQLDQAADYFVKQMATATNKPDQVEAFKNYKNLRAMYSDIKTEVNDALREEMIEDLLRQLKDFEFQPIRVGF